jgi:flagellar biogenesis protein FliO
MRVGATKFEETSGSGGAAVARFTPALFREGGRAFWQWLMRLGNRPPRRLRLCESLPLGERRFVAVVEFERSRFLVGGTSTSLVLLARLGSGNDETIASDSCRMSTAGEQAR